MILPPFVLHGPETKHLVMFSGGLGSWGAAQRVAQAYGTENLYLVFSDTRMEDEDLYRFIDQTSVQIGGTLIKLVDGRTPWDVFFQKRFLGNSRIDPCSKILKRQITRKWLKENFDPLDCVIYLGMDWTEAHRFEKAIPYWAPWRVRAPLCEPPFVTKQDLLTDLQGLGIEPPRLYAMGFPHNNCGGFCCKAGQAHFRLLLEKLPDRYAFHEAQEERIRVFLGKDVSMLIRERNKQKFPLTLRALREEIQGGGTIDEHDWGGCGCFTDIPDHEDPEEQEFVPPPFVFRRDL